MRTLTFLSIFVCNLGVARADLPRCAQGHTDLVYTANDLPEVSGDTGWFPSSSPAQLRITGKVIGQTTVAMSLDPNACWDSAMAVTAPGTPKSGLLDSEYGAELAVYGKIHASVLGLGVNWSGQIPLPHDIPTNFLMAGTTQFEPTALPGSTQPQISVTSNKTDPVDVISTDVLGQLLGITGVSGGLGIEVQGEMTTSYRTTSIAIGSGAIAQAGGEVAMPAPTGGFAGTLGATIRADGVVHYAPTVVFTAHFDVKLLGITVANWNIASVSMGLPGFDRTVTLAGAELQVALPHLDPVPTAAQVGQTLKLHNAGAMQLEVEVQGSGAPVIVPAGGDGELDLGGAVDGQTLVLATNDPDHGEVTIAMSSDGSGGGGENGVGHAGGCSAGGGGVGFGAIGLLLGLRRRKMRA